MKESPWKRYAVTAGIGIGVFLILMLVRGGFGEPDPAARWSAICDALFIPGILLTSIGLLLFVSDGGVFDMLKFGITKAFSVILPKEKRDAQPKTFYDYKVIRDARPRAGIGHYLAVGLIMVALAGIALYMVSR